MSNKSPIFPIAEAQHFSDDYGFDPQIDYFQILKEARKHKIKEDAKSFIDTLQFKLQKSISKDEFSKKIKKNSHRKKWWRNALFFFKWNNNKNPNDGDLNSGRLHRRRAVSGGSIYGPVYITECRTGSSSPRRKTRRLSSARLDGTFTPSRKSELEIPYINLKEFNMERQHRISTISAAPIYLVT